MFFKILYNIFLFPIFFFVSLVLCIFNRKLFNGVKGRFKSKKILKDFLAQCQSDQIYWFHAASLGEYEQIKPVLSGLKEIEPNAVFILSFFSPSGYEYVNDDQVDCKFYLPFDFSWNVKSYLTLANPKKLILAGYDVWPNLIWVAKKLNVHTVLFAARFSNKSSKLYPFIRKFYHNIYNSFSAIYTISKNDNNQLGKIIGENYKPILRVLGNPRYDQVKNKSDQFTKERTQSVLQRPKRLILGSMHSDDEKRLNQSIVSILNEIDDLSLVWAYHNPTEKNLNQIEDYFNMKNYATARLGNKNIEEVNKRIILVDSIGKLAQLYWHGQIAYIGGGFSSGVHNVMEPAIARLPVFFGPNYANFHEAEELISKGGGFSIESGSELFIQLKSLLENSSKFMNSSYSATNVVHDNLGSSTRIVRSLIHD
jgi:3-deoxy-D-manno-octulosonic-acid transferase